MKFLYFLISVVFGDVCCFTGFGSWQPSPLTCGEVCSKRKRDLLKWTAALGADQCHGSWFDGNSCPWAIWEEDCNNIDCREFFRSPSSLLNLSNL